MQTLDKFMHYKLLYGGCILLFEEYKCEAHRVTTELFLSCYHQTDQGVIKIKEWQTMSHIEILKEIQSSGTISVRLSSFVQFLIDEVDSVASMPIIQKSAIENSNYIEEPVKVYMNSELIVDPCNDRPFFDVVGKDPIRLPQADNVDPKPLSKCIETTSSISNLGGQQQ